MVVLTSGSTWGAAAIPPAIARSIEVGNGAEPVRWLLTSRVREGPGSVAGASHGRNGYGRSRPANQVLLPTQPSPSAPCQPLLT